MKYLVLALTFILGGCATIMHGTLQRVSIDSSPASMVRIDNSQTVSTPAIVELKRKDSHIMVFHATGNQDAIATLDPSLSAWVFGNIIFGPWGLIGAAVDITNGAAYNLEQGPSPVSVSLHKVQ